MTRRILTTVRLVLTLTATLAFTLTASGEAVPAKYLCGSSSHLHPAIVAATNDNRPPALLMMSGGGSRGAWGAGFINGWRANAAPTVDVITGVSAGAIASTYVFLGKRYAKELESLFTQTTNDDFYRKRFLLFALFSNSLYTTGREEETIARLFNDELLAEVAKKPDDTPLLCVGTVNLRSGEFVEWNLKQIAIDQNYDLYRKILRASTALPVLFPPVKLYGELHADGGVRQNVFATLEKMMVLHALEIDASSFSGFGISTVDALDSVDAASFENLLQTATTVTPNHLRPTAYIVINGKVDVGKADMENKIFPIAKRAFSILINERLHGNLYQLHYYLNNSVRGGAVKKGWQFRFTRIPSGDYLPCAMIDFDPECMRGIYAKARAKNGQWEKKFPELSGVAL